MKRSLLFIVLLIGTYCLFAQDAQIGDLFYYLDDEEYTAEVTYDAESETVYSMVELSIPSTVEFDGDIYRVVSIGDEAFANCSQLKSVSLPSSIKRIGEDAFINCTDLISVTMSDSIYEIAKGAFQDCSKLHGLTIPGTVSTIGFRAFGGCSSLASINLPASIQNIGSDAFQGCINLPVRNNCRYADGFLVESVDKSITSFVFDKQTRWIGANAFEDCDKLTSVTIPSGIKGIGIGAFYYCSNLKNIYFEGDLSDWLAKEWSAEAMPNHYDLYFYNAKVVNVVIPKNTTQLPNYIFDGCSSLQSVSIPSSISSIPEGAFRDCISLTSITIPSSVQSISKHAFEHCDNLKDVYFEGTVAEWCAKEWKPSCFARGYNLYFGNRKFTKLFIEKNISVIPSYAFNGCGSLESLTIPVHLTDIQDRAFEFCDNLQDVYYEGSITDWLSKSWTSLSLPYNYNLYFGKKKVVDVIIPEGITSIPTMVFRGCGSLKTVTIPKSVQKIERYPFYGCNQLISITMCSPKPVFIAYGDLGVNSSVVVFVPKASLDKYKASWYWNTKNLQEK